MIGSESPVEELSRFSHLPVEIRSDLDDQKTLMGIEKPSALSADEILIVHSSQDRVISHLQLSQVGEMWGVPTHVLRTVSSADHADSSWSEDVQHDFLASELLPQVYDILFRYLIQLKIIQ